jgi:enolase-phosphatase E1
MTQSQQPVPANISHLLLDIEGTTCPVSFVADTLFPYARDRLEPFLLEQRMNPLVRDLVADIIHHWRQDPDPKAPDFNRDQPSDDHGKENNHRRVVPYLQYLIDNDRKLTALKDLQGMIWKQGYEKRELQAPLFTDVPPALQLWYQQGLTLAVYSSGSTQAQQLLYRHSTSGDLSSLFKYWFDTRMGSKKDPGSYLRISEAMALHPETVLFISDISSELDAACKAGMRVLFSKREGNPDQDSGIFPAVTSFEAIRLPLLNTNQLSRHAE